MPKLMTSFLCVALLSLAGCGSEDASSGGTGGGGANVESGGGAQHGPDIDGHIKVTIDGKEWVCEGRIKNRGLTFDKKRLHLILVGRLPATADHQATDLYVTLIKNNLDLGRYELIANESALKRREGKLAHVKLISVDAGLDIDSRKGTVTFDKLVTTEEGARHYKVLHAAGTFEGTFGKGDKSHTVKGSFEFAR